MNIQPRFCKTQISKVEAQYLLFTELHKYPGSVKTLICLMFQKKKIAHWEVFFVYEHLLHAILFHLLQSVAQNRQSLVKSITQFFL